MTDRGRACDVFISNSMRDAPLAMEVADACRSSGLEVFTSTELPAGRDISDALWEALAESRAVIMILSPTDLTAAMAFEIGAARAWNKPIYAIVSEPSTTRLPSAMAGIDLYTTGRLEDVIHAIKTGVEQLTEEDRVFLSHLYSSLDISVDQLAFEPVRRGELVKEFKKGRGKTISEEKLLSELLRLRKQGRLMKRSTRRPKGSRSEVR
jgi:nucleoside 2-deoxyribosyltransferase